MMITNYTLTDVRNRLTTYNMAYSDSLYCYDVSSANNIVEISRKEMDGFAKIIKIRNDTLLTCLEQNLGMNLWDYTDAYSPDSLESYQTEYDIYDCSLSGQYVYTTHGDYGMLISGINISGIYNQNRAPIQTFTIHNNMRTISVYNPSDETRAVEITDITGRVIGTTTIKPENTYTLSPKTGIYFVIDRKAETARKMIIIR